MARIVVVGGGGGGDAAAMALRQHGFTGDVVLVSAEPHLPYERPLLSKEVLTGQRSTHDAVIRGRTAYAAVGVELLLGKRVVAGDRAQGVLELEDGERLSFDHLILATGSRPRRLPDGPIAQNVHLLRSLDDAVALRAQLLRGGQLLVVGAGFLGCEVAASARALGCEVVLVDVDAEPMASTVGRVAGSVVRRWHTARGVDVRMRTAVARWRRARGRVVGAELSDGMEVATAAVVLAVGSEPCLELARNLGLREAAGGIAVDRALRAAPAIHCVGDIAAQRHPLERSRVRAEHWQVAQRQGAFCGAAIARGTRDAYTEPPWFWSDQYELKLTQVGCPRGADASVIRGDPRSDQFSVLRLRGGRLVSALGVNDSVTVRRCRRLIERGVVADADRLHDATSDLRELAAAS